MIVKVWKIPNLRYREVGFDFSIISMKYALHRDSSTAKVQFTTRYSLRIYPSRFRFSVVIANSIS